MCINTGINKQDVISIWPIIIKVDIQYERLNIEFIFIGEFWVFFFNSICIFLQNLRENSRVRGTNLFHKRLKFNILFCTFLRTFYH